MRNYHRTQFDNGLRLVTYPMPTMKSIAIGIWVGIGGRYEDDSVCGVSHFLEHMFFKGTQKRSAVEISRAIEGIGGSMNAFTSEEMTCFYVKVISDYFDQALDVLADMIKDPAFKPADIDRERNVILEELRMHVDVPSSYVFELLRKTMWPKHPLGRMLVGTEKTLKHIQRKQLFSYKNANYTARNTVIALAGRINEEKVTDTVARKFSFLKRGAKSSFIPTRDGQRKSQCEILSKKTEQTHFCMGIRALHRTHPDRFALRVLNAILGENMSSRLFQEIREKLGLSYDIGSSVERFLDTGSLVISGGVTHQHLAKALEKTLQELEKLKKLSVQKSELEMAKTYCIGQAALGMEKTSSQMVYMGETELGSGQIPTLGELNKKIQKVSEEDLQRVAQNLFIDPGINLAIIGPVKRDKTIQDLFHLT